MDKRPIGVFDSGLGGLTVVKAMKKLLPNESILYFGDTARLPYGMKSKELVIQYSNQIAKFLIKKNAKMIIVACNTATAMALEELKYDFKGTPIIGVIEPGSIQASLDSLNKKIGVIGTVATIKSEAYKYALKSIDNNINVESFSSFNLEYDSEIAQVSLASLEKEISKIDLSNVDGLFVSCTALKIADVLDRVDDFLELGFDEEDWRYYFCIV